MNALDTLAHARSREVPWPLIVMALRQLTESSSVDDKGRPWIEVAAHLTGYSTNQLYIGQRTFSYIETFINSNTLPRDALDWPLSNLEVIVRIAKVKPEHAKKLLKDGNQKSLRELRNYYSQVRTEAGSKISAMSEGHQSAKYFTNKLFGDLSGAGVISKVLGVVEGVSHGPLKAWPGRYPYVHPDFFVGSVSNGKTRLTAFEGLRFYGDVTSQVAIKAALKAAVEATFFSQYFWCLPNWVSTADLERLRGDLQLLNVGIIVIGDVNVESVLYPLGPAIHDRQSILLDDGTIMNRLSAQQ